MEELINLLVNTHSVIPKKYDGNAPITMIVVKIFSVCFICGKRYEDSLHISIGEDVESGHKLQLLKSLIERDIRELNRTDIRCPICNSNVRRITGFSYELEVDEVAY